MDVIHLLDIIDIVCINFYMYLFHIYHTLVTCVDFRGQKFIEIDTEMSMKSFYFRQVIYIPTQFL